jgi:hypothetical protein
VFSVEALNAYITAWRQAALKDDEEVSA